MPQRTPTRTRTRNVAGSGPMGTRRARKPAGPLGTTEEAPTHVSAAVKLSTRDEGRGPGDTRDAAMGEGSPEGGDLQVQQNGMGEM